MIIARSPGLIRRERPGLIRSIGVSKFGRALDRPRRISSIVPISIYEAIVKAGETPNLQFAIDAGHIASWPGSGQSVLDLSGNGQDFFLGLTGSPEGSDPAANGQAGKLSTAEYFYGPDETPRCLDYDAVNEPWMNNLGKDGDTHSFFGLVQIASGGAPFIYGNVWANPGLQVSVSETSITINQRATSGGTTFTGTPGVPASKPTFVGISINENGGAVSFLWNDGNIRKVSGTEFFNANYANTDGSVNHFALGCVRWSQKIGQGVKVYSTG